MIHKALDIEQVTKLCHVSATTVLRWIQENSLKVIRFADSPPQIWRADLIVFLKTIHEPIPRELVLLDKISVIVAIGEEDLRARIFDELRDLLPNTLIVQANTAFEAGLAAYELSPYLYILDLEMPGIDWQSIGTLLKSKPRLKFIKIIGIARHAEGFNEKKILEAGFDAFFSAPLDLKAFKDAIVYRINELM